MTIKEIVVKFVENPERMRMGAGKLSRRYNCSESDIYTARTIARNESFKDIPTFVNNISIPNYKNKVKGNRKINETTTPGMHILQVCAHVPFQNKKMQDGIIELIKDLGDKVKGFHLLGDILDMNSLSAHEPNKVPLKGITLGYEYTEGNKYLDSFEKVLPKGIDKTYIYGNHEDRYRRHVSDINNSKYADALMSPRQALKLDERGYLVKDNWKEDYVFLGNDLQMIHGEFCTKYPARTHVDRMKASVIFGHTHRIDINYDGEKAGFNIGWGGDVNAPAFNYVSRLTKMNWINGFAIVHIDEKGNYFTQVIPVFNNQFWYDGKCYGK